MTKIYYEIDLNHGAFEGRGQYQSLVTAKAQLKTYKEKGFEKAFIVKVTEERLKLDEERILRVFEQVERLKAIPKRLSELREENMNFLIGQIPSLTIIKKDGNGKR